MSLSYFSIYSVHTFRPTVFLFRTLLRWLLELLFTDSLAFSFPSHWPKNTWRSAGHFWQPSQYGGRVRSLFTCISIRHGRMHTPLLQLLFLFGIGTGHITPVPRGSGFCSVSSPDSW